MRHVRLLHVHPRRRRCVVLHIARTRATRTRHKDAGTRHISEEAREAREAGRTVAVDDDSRIQ